MYLWRLYKKAAEKTSLAAFMTGWPTVTRLIEPLTPPPPISPSVPSVCQSASPIVTFFLLKRKKRKKKPRSPNPTLFLLDFAPSPTHGRDNKKGGTEPRRYIKWSFFPAGRYFFSFSFRPSCVPSVPGSVVTLVGKKRCPEKKIEK